MQPKKWTHDMKKRVSVYFEKYIAAGRAPGKDVCEKFLEGKEHLFPGRTWRNVKDCVRNLGKAHTRK